MKKIIGIGVLVAVIGLLVFGAVNRTMAKSEEIESDVQGVSITEDVYGNSNGDGNGNSDSDGNSNGNGDDLDSGNSGVEVDHPASTTSLASLPVGVLTQDEIDALFFMREEEKLARDVYTYLAVQWDLPMFSNIASSEQTHMDSVLDLIDRYGLTDSASDQSGVFNNPELQSLYTQLINQGSLSLVEALKVGAAIEEIDIMDLQERMVKTDQLDIQQVFGSLLNGSYNHLNAFVGNLENRSGVIYEPQYLSVEVYQSILTADGSAGGAGIGGGGNGNGNGNGRP